MKISSLSVPKYRDLSGAGDDTILVLPNLIGVFDGATSTPIPGCIESPGKTASVAAAIAVAELSIMREFHNIDATKICAKIRDNIVAACRDIPAEINPATTMAVAGFTETDIRIVVSGDSGVRVNGTDIYRKLKFVDTVTAEARVAIFKLLANKHKDTDKIEELTRYASFYGLNAALDKKILSKNEADAVLSATKEITMAKTVEDLVDDFLMTGINSQIQFANVPGLPLSYSVLNKNETLVEDVIDVRLQRSEVHTLEIFSDGYFSLPSEDTSITAWEREFAAVETRDFSKLYECKNVKGSTGKEFSDDRSLIVATNH